MEKVIISIDFPVLKSEVEVTVKSVLQIDDKRSYEYLWELNNILTSFKKNINF